MALLPKGQREQVLFLIGLIAVAGAGIFWYLVYSPKSEELAQREERVEQLVEMNRKAQLEMAKGNVSELRAQLAEYQENLALVRTLVPQGNELPSLLDAMQPSAYGIFLIHYVPVLWMQHWLLGKDLSAFSKAGLSLVFGLGVSWLATLVLRSLPGAKRVL